jgi:hypothetical protein
MTRPSASVTLGQTKSPAVVGRGEVSPGKGRRLDRRGQARRLSAAGAPGGRCCPPLYPARIRLDRPLDAFSGAGFLAAGPARLRRLPADPRAFCAGGGTRLALRHRQSSILNTVWIVHSKLRGCRTHMERIVSVHDLFWPCGGLWQWGFGGGLWPRQK